jgi:adenylate cyclase, class 2
MAALRETEVKLPVSNLRTIRRRLKSLGFRVERARRLESNWLFDFADSRLRSSHCLLRLRVENGQALVTFKGAPLASRVYKVRREIETGVADGRRVREIFQGLGLGETFCYQKYRTTFARNRDRAGRIQPLVELDQTPIGDYLELEGPPRWIDQVSRGLGYTRKDYITASYAALYFEYCRLQGCRPRGMTFRA